MFKHPCSCMGSYPTMSGKTQFLVNMLKFAMLSPSPQRIIWFYINDQLLYQSLQVCHQNLFDIGSKQRKVSLNTNYFVIFNNPLDTDQISVMSSQMYAKNSKFLVEAYSNAPYEKYGLLVIDMRQDTDDM